MQRDSEIPGPLDQVVHMNVLLWPVRRNDVVNIGAVSLKGSAVKKTLALEGNFSVDKPLAALILLQLWGRFSPHPLPNPHGRLSSSQILILFWKTKDAAWILVPYPVVHLRYTLTFRHICWYILRQQTMYSCLNMPRPLSLSLT